MTKVQIIRTEKGEELAVLPRAEYERLLDLAESATDAAAFDAAKQALACGEEELVPDTVADRLLAGEAPLKVWREWRGLTQTALAARAGVPQSVISAIERRRRRPSLAAVKALARALAISLDDLEPARE